MQVVEKYLYLTALGVELEDIRRWQVSCTQGLHHQTLGALLAQHVDASLASISDALMQEDLLRTPRAHDRTLHDRGETLGVRSTERGTLRVRLARRDDGTGPSVRSPDAEGPDVAPDVEYSRRLRKLEARDVVRASKDDSQTLGDTVGGWGIDAKLEFVHFSTRRETIGRSNSMCVEVF